MSDKKIEQTIESYDKNAEIYCEYTFDKISQYELTQFSSYIKGKKILDVCCGCGRDSDYFLEDGYDVVGVDFSKKIIKEGKKRTKAKLRHMDVFKMTFKDESFHGAWCCASLIHIPKKKIVDFVKEMARVLKEEGVLYISCKEGEGEKIVKYKKLNGAKVLFVYYEQQELETILEENGFDLLKAYSEEINTSNWINIFARKKKSK